MTRTRYQEKATVATNATLSPNEDEIANVGHIAETATPTTIGRKSLSIARRSDKAKFINPSDEEENTEEENNDWTPMPIKKRKLPLNRGKTSSMKKAKTTTTTTIKDILHHQFKDRGERKPRRNNKNPILKKTVDLKESLDNRTIHLSFDNSKEFDRSLDEKGKIIPERRVVLTAAKRNKFLQECGKEVVEHATKSLFHMPLQVAMDVFKNSKKFHRTKFNKMMGVCYTLCAMCDCSLVELWNKLCLRIKITKEKVVLTTENIRAKLDPNTNKKLDLVMSAVHDFYDRIDTAFENNLDIAFDGDKELIATIRELKLSAGIFQVDTYLLKSNISRYLREWMTGRSTFGFFCRFILCYVQFAHREKIMPKLPKEGWKHCSYKTDAQKLQLYYQVTGSLPAETEAFNQGHLNILVLFPSLASRKSDEMKSMMVSMLFSDSPEMIMEKLKNLASEKNLIEFFEDVEECVRRILKGLQTKDQKTHTEEARYTAIKWHFATTCKQFPLWKRSKKIPNLTSTPLMMPPPP